MLRVKPFRFKLCLIGECAVGKTSLIRRFVSDQFDDRYVATIGTKITKKEIKVQHPDNGGLLDVGLLIWDIMGVHGFYQVLQEAYFYGTQGIIAVCDITRENTLLDLDSWMDAVHSVTEGIPTVFLGNKCDLMDKQELDLDELKSFASGYEKAVPYLSSAKTGLNVELAFKTLSEKILEMYFN